MLRSKNTGAKSMIGGLPLDAGDLIMTDEQKRFLDHRFREAAGHQPDLAVLRGLLLSLGGVHLVAPPFPDPDLPLVIDAGFVMAGPVARRTMEKSECHRNVAEIWAKKRHGLVGIGTGYSLNDDGLWRQHSWGLLREGILETTVPRAKYFGVLLQHGAADLFAIANLADADELCGSVKRKTKGR
jgi:hypothetical protein